jgi:hypothetical protein
MRRQLKSAVLAQQGSTQTDRSVQQFTENPKLPPAAAAALRQKGEEKGSFLNSFLTAPLLSIY